MPCSISAASRRRAADSLRKQMADVGMANTPYIGGDGISDEEFLKIAGIDGEQQLLHGRRT